MLTPSPAGRCPGPVVRLSLPAAVLYLSVYAWDVDCRRRVDDLKAFMSRPLLLLFCNAFNPPIIKVVYSFVKVPPACAAAAVWPPCVLLIVVAPVFGFSLVLVNGRLVLRRLRWLVLAVSRAWSRFTVEEVLLA